MCWLSGGTCGGWVSVWTNTDLSSFPGSSRHLLCDLWIMASPLWTPISSSVKWSKYFPPLRCDNIHKPLRLSVIKISNIYPKHGKVGSEHVWWCLYILLFISISIDLIRGFSSTYWPPPPSGSPPGLHRLPLPRSPPSHQFQLAELEDSPAWCGASQSSLAPGLQGSVPRDQTLELAQAPFLGRTDGVCKCTWISHSFWQRAGRETHRRVDEREVGAGLFSLGEIPYYSISLTLLWLLFHIAYHCETYYSSPFYPQRILSKLPSGGDLKPWIVPMSIFTMFSLYIPMIKFTL